MNVGVWGRAGLVSAALAALPAVASAGTVSLNAVLANPSFEVGPLGVCPQDWFCREGSPKEFDPADAEYATAIPDGSNVARLSGRTTLEQRLAIPYVVGDTYTLDFWLGNPLGLGAPTTFTFSLLVRENGNWITDSLCGLGVGSLNGAVLNAGACTWQVVLPADGAWTQYSLSYTRNNFVNPNASLIGIQFVNFANSTSSNAGTQTIDIDLLGPAPLTSTDTPVPEPATLTMLGIGVAGLVARRRRQRQ